eukprot:gene1345-11427_t
MEKHHKDVLEEKGFYSVESIDRTFSSHERKEMAKYTMLMMIMENRPFSMIQGKWYKLMKEKIQRNWTPTDHKTFDLYLDEVYDEILTNVKKELKNIDFFCQTSDGWKSISQDNYNSINLHYINENWEYISTNLGAILVEEDHISGELLSEHYNGLYKAFGIEDSQMIKVIDGGTNLKNAAAILKQKNIHCNCHALQLPIKNELVSIDDNDTRWNSFLQMIERIHKLKEDLKIAFELIKSDKLIKTKAENLSEEEYAQIEFLIKFLTPFRTTSKYFEMSHVNSNIGVSGMIPIIGNLINHCQTLKKETKNRDMLNMIDAIEERMIDDWKDVDIIFYSTAFVNPILKTLSFLNVKESIVKYIKSELNKIEIPDEDLKREEKEKEF